jgi:hypothetical protein
MYKAAPGPLTTANTALASLLGGPVDISNLLLGATGLSTSNKPFGGSENIMEMMSTLGILPKPEKKAIATPRNRTAR